MNFLRKNWYYLGALLLVALAAALSFIWGEISTLRAMMLLSFMALLAHQFEEYAWPGGFPAVINLAVMPSGNKPDRYPLNRMTSLFVNVIFAYPFYLGSVIFCNQVWLGLGLVLFGMFQLGFHGIQINKKMQSIYNPGLFTAIVLFWPIGIYYMWYVADQNLSAWWMWPVGGAIAFAATFFGVYLPITHWFKDENSCYPFSPQEMARFRVEQKMNHLASNQQLVATPSSYSQGS
ncbi:HXXEE domain-containing protein [Bythopirellula goksoeyrii]|uniref:HXXEE domain-containing protein n=1 Tax=Bythopirellula goksoeyrii TaxID=1400387 RepID=A0A5B9QJT9_9BACT|nr:HXXEE domain-containing protein [Bythopirellula goksoeyrii]QEG34363.1 hypothetical protein Pr1d_16390 [Bythopirellula goksoeyrii]